MEVTERLAQIRAQIFAAFAKSEPLPSDAVASHECDECDALRADLGGVAWYRMPRALIETHCGSLPLLSAEALAYFLPAYLLYALDHFTPDSQVTELLIYQLAPQPAQSEDQIEWRRGKLRHVSSEQIVVINDFLLMVEGDEAFRVAVGDVGPGRRRTLEYWEDRWRA